MSNMNLSYTECLTLMCDIAATGVIESDESIILKRTSELADDSEGQKSLCLFLKETNER